MYNFDMFPIKSIQSKHEIDLQSLATTGIEPDAFSHVKSMFCFKYVLFVLIPIEVIEFVILVFYRKGIKNSTILNY